MNPTEIPDSHRKEAKGAQRQILHRSLFWWRVFPAQTEKYHWYLSYIQRIV